MALEALTARANTGTGTDQLAVVNTAQGKAGAVALVDAAGVLVDGANPVPVEVANFPATQPVSAASLPLPAGAATETSLAALNAKIANTASGALLTGTARDRFFDNFADFDTTEHWEVIQSGAGMSAPAVAGGAAAGSSPYLLISSGTTINSRTVILSRPTFNAPVDLRYQISASQRIANNRFTIGFVQVDDAGAILTSTTITTAPDVLNARNALVHQHDGTVATTANLRVRAAGSALDTFANAFGAGFTTVATGTGPNWLPATTYGLTFERDRINARAYGQNVLTNTGGQFGYDRVLPNPTVRYKLAIIVENLGVAPASSTDWRIHLINVMDATRLDVSPRNAGSLDSAKAFPVVGAVTVSGTVTATVGASITGGTISPLTVAGASAEASAARTTSGNSAAALTNASGRNAHFFVNVTAVTGTSPTLVVRVQLQDPVGLGWIDLPGAATATITGTGLTLLTVANLPRTYRLAWTIGGTTPSFTFSVGIAPVI